MNIFLINIGCKVNFADLSHLKSLLIEENYNIIETTQNADVVLINTCAVTNQAAAESLQKIRKIRKLLPSAFIGVMGCYAQLSANEIIEKTGADVVFGTNEKFKIHKLLPEAIKNNTKKVFVSDTFDKDIDASMSADIEARTRGFLKLQDGCSYKCSYCIVPFARGESRSVPFHAIPNKINKLINAGYKEIVISGINLSDYKGENNETFIDLIKMLANTNKYFISNDIRFRISSIEPQVINEEIIKIIAENPTICPHFHIPLQSGCDEILKKMQRRYNTTQFRKIIEIINKYMPFAFIGLDVISGFPTETDDNFIATKDFISSLNISKLHCFTYSAKQGTIAANMTQLPKQIKKARTKELLQLSKHKNTDFVKKNVNNTLLLLPEKYDAINQITSGHTENYLEINVKTDKKLENNFYKVIISSTCHAELV
ncbi:MAG: tRNA (N(6)-L-threonylcarbamoyladenosine(37)-C(2))-methylthiotransferase MtaB [Bacteroidetes bacterium]|nr:tRNA (N(6)-L-threonylcarbamoyladenosine(37)-C(2))-methylthiotransferase MtaB [Bacteroidota bacterium]